MLLLQRKAMTNLDSVFKKQRHHLSNKGLSSQNCFSSSHAWMWELAHKEDWALKKWCFQTVVLEKTLEGPLDIKEIKPINPKGNQPWIYIERTDAKAQDPILWPLNAKSWLIGKDPDAWKNWGQEEKRGDRSLGGWMASLIEWTWVWANSGRQWWGRIESDMTYQLNNSNKTQRGTLALWAKY